MDLTFGQVEEALAGVYRIRPDRRSAFSNRLKHLQKLKFPPGINTGRGRAAVYKIDHALRMALAIELAAFGTPPERSVQVLMRNSKSLRDAVSMAMSAGNLVVLRYFPDGLSDLSEAGEDLYNPGFFATWPIDDQTPGSEIRLMLHAARHGVALIDLSTLIWNVLAPLSEMVGIDLRDSLKRWANNEGGE